MARTNDVWETGIDETYIQTIGSPNGYNLLINGTNHYLNFNSIVGSSGYGIRDNAGVMEFKNSSGSWAGFGSGGGGGVTSFNSRIGPVTLSGADVVSALGYVPGIGNGTVTNVATNATLTGGPITNSGSLGLNLSNINNWLANQGFGRTPTTQVDIAGQIPTGVYGAVAVSSAPTSVVVKGDYAYVAIANAVQVFDINNPASPVLISTTTVTGVKYLSIQGNTLYTGGSSLIATYDVSAPASLVLIGTNGIGGNPITAVHTAGRFMFSAGYNTGTTAYSIVVLDITTPPNYTQASASSTGLNATGIFYYEKYLYVLDATASKLIIYDGSFPLISNVTNNQVNLSALSINANPAGIVVESGYAYIVSSGSPGTLQIVNVETPTAPVVVSSLNLGNGTKAIKKMGRYVYVLNNGASTIQVIDVLVPASPSIVGSFSTASTPTSFDIKGHYLYAVNSGTPSLQVFDLGGSYIQQLQSGSLETSRLDVKGVSYLNDLAMSGSGQINGSLTIQNDFASLGNSNIGGRLTVGAVSIIQIQTPVVTVASQVAGAATYSYVVIAKTNSSGDSQGSIVATITNGNDYLVTGPNLITWSQVAGANQYDVYRTVAGGAVTSFTGKLATIGGNTGIPHGNFYSFLDDDSSGIIGTFPNTNVINTTGTFIFQNTLTFSNGSNLLGGSANTNGRFVNIAATQWKNTGTAASGTAANFTAILFGTPTLTAFNTSVTTTNAYNVNINGAPIASTNMTTVNSTALNIASVAVKAGTTNSYGLQVNAMTGATNNYAAYFNGSVGFSTNAPTQPVDINGNIRLRSGLYDGSNSVGTLNQVLTSTSTATAWKNVPITVSTDDKTGQTATVSLATYTTPNDGANHQVEVGAYLAITAISAGTVTLFIAYTDETNTARTANLFPMGLTSAAESTTGAFQFPNTTIRCKPNTTVIVTATFAGVSVTFDIGDVIKLLN